MGKPEIALDPPAPSAPTVRKHRKMLEIERDALRASAAELAFASAKADSVAREALAAIPGRLAALQFEIDLNHECQLLAHAEDAAAEAAWRTSIQTLPPEEIIAGINKESCCRRCTPGIHGGCVITASARYSGGTCNHPVRERHLFQIDNQGMRKFAYRDNPQASRIFDAACEKLKVRKEFV